jgi:hypothetical protein
MRLAEMDAGAWRIVGETVTARRRCSNMRPVTALAKVECSIRPKCFTDLLSLIHLVRPVEDHK